MRMLLLIGLVLGVLLAGCGDSDDPATAVPAPQASQPAGDAAEAPPATVATGDDALAALERMPDDLEGAARTGETSVAAYANDDGTAATLEVMEAGDVVGPGETVDEALEDMQAMVSESEACSGASTACLRGLSPDGQHVALWVSPGRELIFVAVAPTRQQRRLLEDAWSEAVGG